MYFLQCAGGYANPVKDGKFNIMGVCATVKDTTAASRVTLVDNAQRACLASSYAAQQEPEIIDIKGVANVNGILQVCFDDPLVARKGLSCTNADNIVAGSLKVFVK